MAKVTKFDPHAAAVKKAQRVQASPSFMFSPKAILGLFLLVSIPVVIYLGKVGPVNAMHKWKELEPKLNDQTNDVVQKVINEQYKGVKFDEFTRPPKVTNVMIDGPTMMIMLPAEVPLQGKSTEGHFYGTYFTENKRFEMQVGVDSDSRKVDVKAHVDEKGFVQMDEMK